jgi:L-rhamnose isomerase
VSYPIIRIPTKSISDEIKGLVVVFIPLQLTLGRVVECIGDHIRLLDDLPNDVTPAQEIVAGSVLLITEILTSENDKLNNSFLHVAFGSESLLKPTGDQTGSNTN